MIGIDTAVSRPRGPRAPGTTADTVRLGLPKGRMQEGVLALLRDAGVPVDAGGRAYRPRVALPGVTAKLLKPQNIVEMLAVGSRDIGFAGADWVAELNCDLECLLDTGLDPVRVVVAAPTQLLEGGDLPARPLVIASEYERLTRGWIAARRLDARFVRSFGATEVFPPEDADVIVDNTATGSTLEANGLEIVDEVMVSTTRLYASRSALEQEGKRTEIDRLVLLLSSVLEARRRVMLEVNVPADRLASIIDRLPGMREPTVSPLYGDGGYAVKAAVLRDRLAEIVPAIKALGGTDLVVTETAQIVP